jgi:hypothetical protein
LFNLFEILKDLFRPTDDSLVGLRRLNEVKIEPEVIKPKVKKEIKISDLMKKTVLE